MNKKTTAIALGTLFGAALFAGMLAWVLTSGPVETADAFFGHVSVGETEEAYMLTSSGFKDLATIAQFEGFVNRGKLAGNQGASWHSRNIEGDKADLEGTLQLVNGAKLPLTLNMVHENDVWLIHGIDLNIGGVK